MSEKPTERQPSPDDGFLAKSLQAFTKLIELARDLPPILRFASVFGLALVLIVLSGQVVQPALVPLFYLLVLAALGGYVVFEWRANGAAGRLQNNPDPVPAKTAQTRNQPAPVISNPPLPSLPDSRPEDLRRAYCQVLTRVCNRLPLETIDPKAATRTDAAELDLSEIYTGLDVAGFQLPENDPRSEHDNPRELSADRSRPSDRLPATAAMSRWPRLVLLGDPGSGKTTLASFISLCLAGDWLGLPNLDLRRLGEGWTLPRLMPVRIVLREYAAEGLLQDSGLWDFIRQRLQQTKVGSGNLAPFATTLAEHLQQPDGGLLVLDGLDEVPEARGTRQRLKEQVLAFCNQFPHCRIVVTARPYAYQNQAWRLPGFEVKRLADFSAEQIAQFIERWYAHIAAKDSSLSAGDAKRYAEQLQTALQANSRLRELAPRPLLLTLMASLHRWRGGGAMPKQRQDLYEQSVNLLMDLWQRPKLRFDANGDPIPTEFDVFCELGIPQEQLRRALERVAYEVHREQAELTGVADIPVGKLAGVIYEASQRKDLSIKRVTEYVTDRAGLLIERAAGQQYAFPHRTFQEYLAACHLTNFRFPYQLRDHLREDDERWREVVLLAASKAAVGTSFSVWSLVGALCPAPLTDPSPPLQPDWYAALRAGQVLVETELYRLVDPADQPRLDCLRAWLTALCVQAQLPVGDRAEAGRTLAVLGDPRPGVGLRPDGSGLPDILWAHVPAGELHRGEAPGDPVSVKRFRLAAYPVTNAQFRPFVEGAGYRKSQYWTEAGWEYIQRDQRTEPVDWSNPNWNLDNHPVVTVTWYEAVAYCRWLTERLQERGELTAKQRIRLPTEAEWEWAARGPTAQVYPWGNEWCDQACNHGATGLNRTCAVGLFPQGAAAWLANGDRPPCHDLSGNVWEWCATKWRDSYAEPADESLDGTAARVLRGGSYYSSADNVRGGYRDGGPPVGRSNFGGFRLAQ